MQSFFVILMREWAHEVYSVVSYEQLFCDRVVGEYKIETAEIAACVWTWTQLLIRLISIKATGFNFNKRISDFKLSKHRIFATFWRPRA